MRPSSFACHCRSFTDPGTTSTTEPPGPVIAVRTQTAKVDDCKYNSKRFKLPCPWIIDNPRDSFNSVNNSPPLCGCVFQDKDDKDGGNATEASQQLRKQLEQQTLQTRQALAQLMLVREQLISETNARVEAQVSVPRSMVSLRVPTG